LKRRKRGPRTRAWTVYRSILYDPTVPPTSTLKVVLESSFNLRDWEQKSWNVLSSGLVPTSRCRCEEFVRYKFQERTRGIRTETSLQQVNHPAEAHECPVQGLRPRG
jgi:hypothetical protein